MSTYINLSNKTEILRLVKASFISVLLGLSACSEKEDNTVDLASSGNTVFNSALAAVNSKLNTLDQAMPDNTSVVTNSLQKISLYSGEWTTAALANPACSGGDTTICNTPVSPKEWMGYQLDGNAKRENGSVINVFGRFKNTMQILCAVMNLLPYDSATGYPQDGNSSFVFDDSSTSLLINECGMAVDDVPPAGLQIDALISTPTDISVYDKKIVFSFPAEMGGSSQPIYLHIGSDGIRLASSEAPHDTPTRVSRTIVDLNSITQVLKVEYFSGGSIAANTGMEYYRLYYDEANDVGSILGAEGCGDDACGIRYQLKAKPKTGGTAALSMVWQGYGSGLTDYTGVYEACVDMASGDVTTESSLACTLTGASLNSSTVHATVQAQLANTGWYDNLNELIQLDFDDNSIFTVAPTY